MGIESSLLFYQVLWQLKQDKKTLEQTLSSIEGVIGLIEELRDRRIKIDNNEPKK